MTPTHELVEWTEDEMSEADGIKCLDRIVDGLANLPCVF
jgi:hypothetical protein